MTRDGKTAEAVCVHTNTDHGTCEWCGHPLAPPSPKWHGKLRRFCQASCRAAWWRRERLRLGATAQEAITALVASLPGSKGPRR